MVDEASYEFAKYTILIFSLFGVFYSRFSRKSRLYLLYFLLLVPTLLITNDFLLMSRDQINVLIMSNIGPICLTALAIYTFGKKVSFAQILRILLLLALTSIAIATNVFLQNPEITQLIHADSNPDFSGLFGPNQVCTL
jgi:type IV secretory pathway VirB6-like protein